MFSLVGKKKTKYFIFLLHSDYTFGNNMQIGMCCGKTMFDFFFNLNNQSIAKLFKHKYQQLYKEKKNVIIGAVNFTIELLNNETLHSKKKLTHFATKSSEIIIYSRRAGSTLQKRSLLYRRKKNKKQTQKKIFFIFVFLILLMLSYGVRYINKN
jgi:hypothetical protein